MDLLDLARANLLSPAVLCFALGVVGVWLRSDLALPEPIFTGLSAFLMLSIGLRGGAELAEAHGADLMRPLIAALALGCLIPLWCFALLRRLAGLSVPDAAALAAHYGSVSAVTFAAVTTMLDRQGVPYEGYAAALLAIMEIPAIVVAIALAKSLVTAPAHTPSLSAAGLRSESDSVVLDASVARGGGRGGFSTLMNEALSSKSIVLLAGGLAIGALVGPAGLVKVKPFFGDLFQGALCLFLLELGRLAAMRAGEFATVGLRLAIFALVMPVLHGALGIGVGWALGMSQGGAIVLGTLAASASYIAAPAAVRLALPEANAGYYLTCSLAITFPFNIVLGLPLYQALARWLYG